MNSVIPVAAAAIAGIPLVNVDGMGRAFPGLQQDSYNIAGVHTWPMAFADEKGNVAMLTTVDNDWMENLGRAPSMRWAARVLLSASSCPVRR